MWSVQIGILVEPNSPSTNTWHNIGEQSLQGGTQWLHTSIGQKNNNNTALRTKMSNWQRGQVEWGVKETIYTKLSPGHFPNHPSLHTPPDPVTSYSIQTHIHPVLVTQCLSQFKLVILNQICTQFFPIPTLWYNLYECFPTHKILRLMICEQ